MSFHVVAVESGAHIRASCAVVRQVAHVFSLLTTSAMPSLATITSE